MSYKITHLAPASYFHMRFAFSPNIAEMRFSRRNPVFLEIRGVYGVSPPLAGAEARGIQELTGRLRDKSRRVINNMVAGICPEQRCDAMRLSSFIGLSAVLRMLVLCPCRHMWWYARVCHVSLHFTRPSHCMFAPLPLSFRTCSLVQCRGVALGGDCSRRW